jgi:hypothetical protein
MAELSAAPGFETNKNILVGNSKSRIRKLGREPLT